MGTIDPATATAILYVGITGAVAGLFGGLAASSRASILGSILMGAIGGISIAAVMRIANVAPLVDAGQGFSYVYAAVGGLVLGMSVSASNR